MARLLTEQIDAKFEELMKLHRELARVKERLKANGWHVRPDGSVRLFFPALDQLPPGANKRG